MKEEFAAEIKNLTSMKIRYDQLVVTSGKEIDSLKNALEIIKAKMSVVTSKLEKCRKRVKTLDGQTA